MMMNIRAIIAKYPFLELSYYGKSVMGKNLPVIKIGTGEKEVFYSASIHANEWINSVVFMKFVEDFAKAYESNGEIFGYKAREIFEKTSIYIAPMTNPDGVDLVLWQIPTTSARYINARSIASNYPDIPFPDGWKSNIVGIDLNLQFPAEWYLARENKYNQGFIRPAPRDFVGYSPLTEPESISLYEFTLAHNFSLILSYHTQGEVIFWRYLNFEPEGAENLGKEFEKVSGYILDDTLETNSFAGYRDWFIENYNRPGYTVETGKGTNPLSIDQFNKIYNDNIGILVLGLKY
jgi:g-D-glutamyl-meso-diaminopimelate peptidase